MPKNGQSIGWIGTGVMGGAMVERLLRAGWKVSIYSRNPSKAVRLFDLGAKQVNSPEELARTQSLVATMVGYPEDVREVVLGAHGLFAGWRNRQGDKMLVDFTTSSPELAREIFLQGEQEGIDTLDAPVSGGDIGARNGTLSIMVGGKQDITDLLEPLWSILGKKTIWQGPAGSGQHTKMVNQILIAGNMIGVCEAIYYGLKSGLNMETSLASVSTGAAGSWSLTNLAPRILAGNFAPGFYVDHFIKDMEIALEECRRMKIHLPGLELVRKLYLTIQEQGYGRSGTQALFKILEQGPR